MIRLRSLPPPDTAITGLQAPHGGLLTTTDWYDYLRALDQAERELQTLVDSLIITGVTDISINGQAVTPSYQVPPITHGLGIGANYSSNGAGNNFTLSSWVEAFGTRPTVGSFGEGIASGAGSQVWGGNFVGYANNATGTGIGVEIDFGSLVAGGVGYGLVIGHTGTQANAGGYIQLQTNVLPAAYGISFEATLLPPIATTGQIIRTVGACTVARGIDITSFTCTHSAFQSNGFLVDGSGNIACAAVAAAGPIFCSHVQGMGYRAGAGGTVAQGSGSGKATTVVLDKASGEITMDGAALAAGTTVSFVLTNSSIAGTDLIVLNHVTTGTFGSYTLNGRCLAGSAGIDVRNVSGGSLSEAIVIRFALIKGATT